MKTLSFSASSCLYTCLILSLLAFPPSHAQHQEHFSFPLPIVSENDTFENYAYHDNPTWLDFRDYANHAVYGEIGRHVGKLLLSYEESAEPYRLHDKGNCTATIISERLLLTNAHCVYSPLFARGVGELQLVSLALAMDVHSYGEEGDVYPVKITPVELNENLDFAILEFAAASPYEEYGAVDLSQHRSARIGESLFMIHHSNITGRLDGDNYKSSYKRLTARDCTRLNPEQLRNINTSIIMPNARDFRSVNPEHDAPHFCDSETGSSGALLYARSDSAPIGLHFSGRDAEAEADRFNLYIDITVICRESRVLRHFCGKAKGSLSLNSNPSGATVSLDGEVIGTTPLSMDDYDVGTYQLSLSYDGYQSHNETIRIEAGHATQRTIRLQAELIRSADELVRRARQGGTLRLAAGTFRLNSTLELSGDVRLIGQGYQQTRIVSSASEYVVRYTGGGTFAAQGVGFEHTGDAIADVVRVENGTLDIDSCQFTGGKFDAEKFWGGDGLWILGSTRGTVRNSIFNDNGLYGIDVNGNAQPRLEQNRLHDNTSVGIYYGDSAGGSAINNESYGNGLHGIGVQGDAQPRLEQNRLHDNTYAGIAYADSAGGSAVSNESYGNGYHGIGVQDNAQPRLEQNHLYDNTQSGIVYAGSAGGSAVGNESYGNGYHGIGVQDNAQPRLEQNRLHDNTESGIAYFHQSGGSARNNQSYNNQLRGIYVASTANPSLSNNTTYGNLGGNVRDLR